MPAPTITFLCPVDVNNESLCWVCALWHQSSCHSLEGVPSSARGDLTFLGGGVLACVHLTLAQLLPLLTSVLPAKAGWDSHLCRTDPLGFCLLSSEDLARREMINMVGSSTFLGDPGRSQSRAECRIPEKQSCHRSGPSWQVVGCGLPHPRAVRFPLLRSLCVIFILQSDPGPGQWLVW